MERKNIDVTPVLISRKKIYIKNNIIKFTKGIYVSIGNEDNITVKDIPLYLSKDEHILEVITWNSGNRLYLDYDEKVSKDEVSRVDELIAKYQKDGFYVSNSSRIVDDKFKISLHCVHSKLGSTSRVRMENYVVKNYPECDPSVYSTYQKFRCVGQSKWNDAGHVKFTMCNGDNVMDYIIGMGYDDEIAEVEIEVSVVVNNVYVGVDFAEFSELVMMLDERYYDKYERWMRVKWVMKNSHYDIDDLYDLWHKFSAMSDKYKNSACSKEWYSSVRKDDKLILLGSLITWCQEVDDVKYAFIRDKYKKTNDCKLRHKIMSDDEFYYGDFIGKWDEKYIDKDEVILFINDMKKCIAYVGLETFIIKRQKIKFEFKNNIKFLNNFSIYVKTEDKHKKLPFLKALKTFSSMKEIWYRYVEFYPGVKPNYVFNLWSGFHAAPVKYDYDTDQIAPILKHIKEVLADGNESRYEYIIAWLKHLVQYPHVKNRVVLAFIGNQGCGKNSIFEFIMKYVVGERICCMLNDLDKLTGRFNSILVNKVLIVLDEASNVGRDRDYHKKFNKMKSLITETKQILERKGIDPIEIFDYSNYVVLSNNEFIAKVENGDRRYAIFKCSSKYCKDYDYFNALHEHFTEKTGIEFMKFLMRDDIKPYNLEQHIPMTYNKLKLIARGLNSFVKFLYYLVKTYDDMEGVCTTPLWESYNRYCVNENLKLYIKSRRLFTMELKNLGLKRYKKRSGYHYFINHGLIKEILCKKYMINEDLYDFI